VLFTAGDDMTIRAWALQDAPVAPNPTSPTLKPPHPPALNILEASERKAAVGVEGDPGTRFTCFTGIKVQILTQKARQARAALLACRRRKARRTPLSHPPRMRASEARQTRAAVLNLLALLVQTYECSPEIRC
jgi:hypothetical protein